MERPNNRWNPDRTPKRSSGGESAVIAAGMSPMGIGNDVAISVRGPATLTEIVALKPLVSGKDRGHIGEATHGGIP
ncbi:MAG TPA: amidase family protein [Bryobacteraceae bacterium]